MCSWYGAIPNYPALDLLNKEKEKKSRINLSGYAQFQFSCSLKYACVLFFLYLVVKQSAGLHLYTQQGLLCLTLHSASVGTSFLDSSPVNTAHEGIPCTWLQNAKDTWSKYLMVLVCFHTWTVCLVPKEIICSKSIAYFPWVVLSSHCITVKPLRPSLKTDPDMRCPVDITATITLCYL